jgi:cytochrome P450
LRAEPTGSSDAQEARTTMADDAVYWEAYDVEIDADPAPVWKRLRDEAPTYPNDKFDFSALSCFDDVIPANRDTATFASKHGTVLDFMSPDPIPGARSMFMDPPEQTRLQALVSCGFTNVPILV